MKTEFTNERGNDITIEVKKYALNDGGHDYVLIHMQGPASEVHNLITRQEADVLYDLLGEVLD